MLRWRVYRHRFKTYVKYAILTVPHKFVKPFPFAFKYPERIRWSDADENGNCTGGALVGLAIVQDKDDVREIEISNRLLGLSFNLHLFLPFPFPPDMGERKEENIARWVEIAKRSGICLWIKGEWDRVVHQEVLPRGRNYTAQDLQDFFCHFCFGKSYKELVRLGAFAVLRRLGG